MAESKEVLGMIALSEEINSLNIKVQQLMRDLQHTEGVLGGVQELTTQLKDKVSQLNTGVGGYKPTKIEYTNDIKPSHIDGINKRERVVPTPDDNFVTEPVVETAPVVKEEKVVKKEAVKTPEKKSKKVVKKREKKVVQKRGRKRGLFSGGSKGIDKFSEKEGSTNE